MRNCQILIVFCLAFLWALPPFVQANDSCPKTFQELIKSSDHEVPHRPSIMRNDDGTEYPVGELSKEPAKKLKGVPPINSGVVPVDLPEKVRFTILENHGLTSTHYVEVSSIPEELRKIEQTVYYGRPAESPEAAVEYLKKLFHEGRRKIGNPTWDIKQHINGPTAAGFAQGAKARTNTGFYSTSSSFAAAVGFGPGNYNTKQGMVVVIEGKGAPGLDLVGFSKYLDQVEKKVLARSILDPREAEVALTGIDSRQIRGAWVATKRVEATYIWNGAETKTQVPYMEFIANPNFDPNWRYGQ